MVSVDHNASVRQTRFRAETWFVIAVYRIYWNGREVSTNGA